MLRLQSITNQKITTSLQQGQLQVADIKKTNPSNQITRTNDTKILISNELTKANKKFLIQ
jgi:hypothetical protein